MSLRTVIRQPRKSVKNFLRQLRENEKLAPQVFPEGDSAIPADIFKYRPVSYHETPHGNYYVPIHPEGDVIATCMRKGRIFEPNILKTADECILPGTVAIDVGANFGQMSLFFSNLIGDNGLVYSFEAQEYVYAVLQKNIAVNHKTNIRAMHAAVFDGSKSEVYFPEPDLTHCKTRGCFPIKLDSGEGKKIKVVTIDQLNIERPISFLKVNAQGSDLHVLRGALETIRKHRMPFLFEYEENFRDEFKTSFQDYIDFVQSIDYRFDKVIDGINFLCRKR